MRFIVELETRCLLKRSLDIFLKHMMSEHATQTHEQGGGFGIVFSGTYDNALLHPHMGQWMAHWIQACKTWPFKGCEKHHNTALVGNLFDQYQSKEDESSGVEKVKSEQHKSLCLNINKRYASDCQGHSSKSPITSSLTDLAPGNFIIANIDKATLCYECLRTDHMDAIRRTSSLSFHECKCQKNRKRVACMFSCRHLYKVSPNTKLGYMQHKLSCCSSSNKFISKETKKSIDSMCKSYGISWTSLNDGSTHVLPESSPNRCPFHFSTEENGKNVNDDSTNGLLLGKKRHIQPVYSNIHHSPSKVPKISMLDVSQYEYFQNLKSLKNGVYKCSSTVDSLMVADEMGFERCQIGMMTGETAFTSLMPAKQYYSEKNTTTAPFKNFTSDENRRHHGGSDTRLFMSNYESFTKDDTLYHNPSCRSSSILGETFSRPSKSVSSFLQTQEAPSRSSETGISCRVEPYATTDRWVNRLQHKSLSDNQFRLCNSPSSIEVQKICSKKHNYQGKIYGSIRAMALMGKTIKNYKPCNFKRKEATLIWTI